MGDKPELIKPGSELDEIQKRFRNDLMFASIVFTFRQGMRRKAYNAQDLIDAAIFAEFANSLIDLSKEDDAHTTHQPAKGE